MRKGVNALEMVFAMFILIVVTLVIIRLFSKTVSENTLPDIKDFRQAYKYDQEIGRCRNACRAYTEAGGCQDLAAAVEFCQKKVKIDIDGDFKEGQKGHHGLIANIPYCEDGLYCFHIDTQCSCGSFFLDAGTCLKIMEDYYKGQQGLPESTSNQIILGAIQPGTCEKDPTKWKQRTFADGTQIIVATLPDGSPLRADYWYTSAGYSALQTGTTTTTTGPSISLSCSVVETNKIKCDWSGCPAAGDITLVVTPSNEIFTGSNAPSGSYTFGPLSSGSYRTVLDCADSTVTKGPYEVS